MIELPHEKRQYTGGARTQLFTESVPSSQVSD